MCLAGTAAMTLALALPALAQDAGFAAYGNMLIFTYEHVAPSAAGETLRAEGGKPASGEQKAPPPAPSGCPFRDGKLELIA
jgi:hypothetical protein